MSPFVLNLCVLYYTHSQQLLRLVAKVPHLNNQLAEHTRRESTFIRVAQRLLWAQKKLFYWSVLLTGKYKTITRHLTSSSSALSVLKTTTSKKLRYVLTHKTSTFTPPFSFYSDCSYNTHAINSLPCFNYAHALLRSLCSCTITRSFVRVVAHALTSRKNLPLISRLR